ncbi:MAG: PAS domain S-box protein [Desulfobacterales bacterium]|nr:PAS domain S-box protein [Desulfobacterales bacterium]
MARKPSYEALEKRIAALEKATSECRQAEATLKENETLFRIIFENSRDAIFITDKGAGFAYVNRAACDLTGYTRDELLRMRVPDLHEPEDLGPFKAFFERIISGEDILSNADILKKDGTKIPVEFSNTRIILNDQPHMHTIARDLTDRIRVETELAKRSEAIEASMDGIAILNDSETYIYVNDAHAKVYGYDGPEELLGKTWRELYDEAELALFETTIMPRFAAEGKWRGESVGKKKDGSRFPQEVSLTAMEGGGLVCVVRDISEQKRAEQEKLEAQTTAALHEKYALVGQIAGKMAHDFNNVLGAVMGNAELALLDCRKTQLQETLELILAQTMRGKNLIRNLTAFAKDQEPRQEYFSVTEKINLVLNLMKQDMKGIAVAQEWAPELPDLLADPGMVEHCLVNLIQNAVHAMSKTTIPRLSIRAYIKREQIYIDIKDNGCGIPETCIPNIFDPGFTLKGSRDTAGVYTPDIKGTGYGMANVKKYVEQHQGTFAIDSKTGRGTQVIISFPAAQPDTGEEITVDVTACPPGTGKAILLVEDESAISQVQYRLLTYPPCSHRVDLAADGRTAMDLLDKNTYDAVSLDYLLPGKISGLDVYTHIRKRSKTLPVLFISGNLKFLESITALKAKDPWIDHVSKPCQNKTYIRRINSLLESAEPEPPENRE